MSEIRMPKLGDAMEEGTLGAYLVADGEAVAEGDEVCLVETDKVEFAVEATAAGVFRHVAASGDVYPVGALLATIEEGS